MASNIYKLDNTSCSKLITAILNYDWTRITFENENGVRYTRFVELYSHFLSVLVSSLPKYLHEVVSKLVMEFCRFDSSSIMSKNHHKLLSEIIRFVPTCVNSLPRILQRHFPHHISSSAKELTNYIGNLTKILFYCQELQYDVWQLIIECSIKLDVELQNELDELDDEEIDALINGNEVDDVSSLNELEKADDYNSRTEKSSNESLEDDDEEEEEIHYLMEMAPSTEDIKKLLHKLDSIIQLLLIENEDSFTEEKLHNGQGVSLFNTISSLFKSHILPTHFTKLTQFIIFHVSQYQPELSDSFLVLLIDVAFNTSEVLEKRLKAMQYLSSYISRAKSLSKSQIIFVLTYLIGWLNKYISERECEVSDYSSNERGLHSYGMERFKLFYVAFQTLMYVFCFRYQMLRSEKESNEDSTADVEWECNIDKFFQRVIIAKFNPLKYCDETVVYIFAKIATKLNVCYCYSIIEHNKRERMLQTNGKALPSAVSNFRQKQEFLDLEAYFPFDPLVLPRSKTIVEQKYIEWYDVNPDTEEDEEGSTSGSQQGIDEDSGTDDEMSRNEDEDEDD